MIAVGSATLALLTTAIFRGFECPARRSQPLQLTIQIVQRTGRAVLWESDAPAALPQRVGGQRSYKRVTDGG